MADNTAQAIAGVDNYAGTLEVTDSTISSNTASLYCGGISSNSHVDLQGSIVAANTGGDVSGSFSGSYDLIGNADGSSGLTSSSTNQHGTTGSPINPDLGPLQNNGGATETMALLPGSPAREAGAAFDDAAGSAIITDQRGLPRSDSAPNIGAYEALGTPNGTAWVDVGSTALIDLPLTASGISADDTATVDWGDGSTPSDAVISVPGGGQPDTVTAAYAYAQVGRFTATVAVANGEDVLETLHAYFVATPPGSAASAIANVMQGLTSGTAGTDSQAIFNTSQTAFNPDFFAAGYNFSCVSIPQASPQSYNATLIAPQIVVEALHFTTIATTGAGASVVPLTFCAPDGTLYVDPLAGVGSEDIMSVNGTDLAVCKLQFPLPTPEDPLGVADPRSLITPASILPADYSTYLGASGNNPVPVLRGSQFGQLSLSDWDGGNGVSPLTEGPQNASWGLERWESGGTDMTSAASVDQDSGNGVFALLDGQAVCLGPIYGAGSLDSISDNLTGENGLESKMDLLVPGSAGQLSFVSLAGIQPAENTSGTPLFSSLSSGGPAGLDQTEPLSVSVTDNLSNIPGGEAASLVDLGTEAVLATAPFSGHPGIGQNTATFTVPANTLSVGDHNLAVVYDGDGAIAGSASNPINI